MTLCHDCIKNQVVIKDKGTPVCQKCFGKRYNKKYYFGKCDTTKFTLSDLKKKWERDY